MGGWVDGWKEGRMDMRMFFLDDVCDMWMYIHTYIYIRNQVWKHQKHHVRKDRSIQKIDRAMFKHVQLKAWHVSKILKPCGSHDDQPSVWWNPISASSVAVPLALAALATVPTQLWHVSSGSTPLFPDQHFQRDCKVFFGFRLNTHLPLLASPRCIFSCLQQLVKVLHLEDNPNGRCVTAVFSRGNGVLKCRYPKMDAATQYASLFFVFFLDLLKTFWHSATWYEWDMNSTWKARMGPSRGPPTEPWDLRSAGCWCRYHQHPGSHFRGHPGCTWWAKVPVFHVSF